MTTQNKDALPADSEPRYRAPALEKGLDILELLSREREALTTSQLASSLGRSVSELFRMVQTLEARGYIAQVNGREGYGLTNKMFSLGVAQTPTRSLIDLALPFMKSLAEDIGQSCHLTVISNDQIVVVARVESPRDLGFSVRVGYRRLIVESSSGIVLSAFQADHERDSFIENLRSTTDPERMRPFLERVATTKGQGYSNHPSDFVEGVQDLSSPIFDSLGAIAALTVPHVRCLPEKFSAESSLEHLRETTHAISQAFLAEGR